MAIYKCLICGTIVDEEKEQKIDELVTMLGKIMK